MILPIVEYGDILYDGSNQNLLLKLQTIRSRALHLVYFRQYHVPVIFLHEVCGGSAASAIQTPGRPVIFSGPYFILSTMEAGDNPIFNVFGMTGPSTDRELNP